MTALSSSIWPTRMARFAATAGFLPDAPATRGLQAPFAGCVLGLQRHADDSVGNSTVTFTGVNANSEIRVFLADGTEQAGVELCSADHALSVPYYPSGAANNNVIIRIINVAWKIKEFSYTLLPVAAQSIPIQQEPDKWYSNP